MKHNKVNPEQKPGPKPEILPVIPENIPDELKQIDQWVLWRLEWSEKKNKWIKPPYNARSLEEKAVITDPDHWATFDLAIKKYNDQAHYPHNGKPMTWDGIGIVMTSDMRIAGLRVVGLDGDDCYCADGTLNAQGQQLQIFETYTERSPTAKGKGIRKFLLGTIYGQPNYGKDASDIGIEIMTNNKYLTVTGQKISGDEICKLQPELNNLIRDYYKYDPDTLRDPDEVLQNAKLLFSTGYSVMYAEVESKRRPPENPKYQTERAELEDVVSWFNVPGRDIEVLGRYNGTYSADFDNHDGFHENEFSAFMESVPAELADKLVTYKTKTEGSYRAVWRCAVPPDVIGGIAWDEDAKVPDNVKAFIEILDKFKVPGGCTLAYEFLDGKNLSDVVEISPEEQNLLLEIAAGLSVKDPPQPEEFEAGDYGDDSPGNKFCEYVRQNPEVWEDILVGWEMESQPGDETRWMRPGGSQASATTGHKGRNILTVFSENAQPFQARESYSPFQALALIHFAGDFSAAARAILTGWGPVPPLRAVETVIEPCPETFEWNPGREEVISFDDAPEVNSDPPDAPQTVSDVPELVSAGKSETERWAEMAAASADAKLPMLQSYDGLKADAAAQTNDWIWQDIIDGGTQTMLFADAFGGKTCFVMNMIVRLASGQFWLGKKMTRVPVLYINSDGMRAKVIVRNIREALTDDMHEEELRDIFYNLVNTEVEITKEFLAEAVRMVQEDVKAKGKDLDTRRVLIVIDTMRAAIMGEEESGSENDSTTMTNKLKPMRKWCGATGHSTFWLAHNNRKGEFAGSGGIPACLDGHFTYKVNENRESTLKVKTREDFIESFKLKKTDEGLMWMDTASQTQTEKDEVIEFILKLPEHQELTVEDIMKIHNMSDRDVRRWIKKAERPGYHPRLNKSGPGVKGTPYTWRRW